MKKQMYKMLIFCFTVVMFVGCGGSKIENNSNETINEVVVSEESEEIRESISSDEETTDEVVIMYPTIEEVEYFFQDSIRYEEPVAVFGYKNNSEFTIVRLDLEFEMKEEITAEQLIAFDSFKEKWELSDDDILSFKPIVYDYMVCDSGEEVVGAICNMDYNMEPISAEQCKFMDLNCAEIYFVAVDNKIHKVRYSAENDEYLLAEETIELYNWSNSEYANMLPKPDTRIVEIDYDKEDYFQCSAYDMSFEDFQAYMKKCEEKGFSWDEDNSSSCWANNEEGYTLHVRYLDYMKMVEISLEMMN